MTQFKSVKSLRALFWGVDYKFEDERKAILSLLDESLEALEKKDYEKVETLLLMIKFGGYKVEWVYTIRVVFKSKSRVYKKSAYDFKAEWCCKKKNK